MKYHLELSILLQKRANQLCLFYRIFASGQELIIKYVMGVNLSSDISFENADFNGDGNIDMLDVITLKNYTDNNTVETTTETTETTTEQQ